MLSCLCRRRTLLAFASAAAVAPCLAHAQTRATPELERHFIAEAERMKAEAVVRGDQPYGAVLVREGAIVGYGRSAVVTARNLDAHAERVALWDAQRLLERRLLPDTIMYSTSRPCSACERALAAADVARMYFGPAATDGGKPAG